MSKVEKVAPSNKPGFFSNKKRVVLISLGVLALLILGGVVIHSLSGERIDLFREDSHEESFNFENTKATVSIKVTEKKAIYLFTFGERNPERCLSAGNLPNGSTTIENPFRIMEKKIYFENEDIKSPCFLTVSEWVKNLDTSKPAKEIADEFREMLQKIKPNDLIFFKFEIVKTIEFKKW